jgi:hypothetical protein
MISMTTDNGKTKFPQEIKTKNSGLNFCLSVKDTCYKTMTVSALHKFYYTCNKYRATSTYAAT